LRAHAVTVLLFICGGLIAWLGFVTGGLLATFAGYGELAFLLSVLGSFAALSMLERLFEGLKPC
jgi:hypothetical protein